MFLIDPYRFAGPAGDPYYTNTQMLLHGDGSTGGLSFPSHSYLDPGTAQNWNSLVTTQPGGQWGEAIYFPGGVNGNLDGMLSWWTAPWTKWDLNIANWTWEMWIKEEDTGTYAAVLSQTYAANGWTLFTDLLEAKINGTWGTHLSWTKPAFNTWWQLTMVKSGTTLYAFVDGVLVDTMTGVTTIGFNNEAMVMGAENYNLRRYKFKGFLEEVRFTPGVARYTADFAVQTAPFPNF